MEHTQDNMKEVYQYIKENSKLPVGHITYTYQDFEGILHPFECLTVNFKEDEKNIQMMEDIKKKYGHFFMFFNNSKEGEDFWRKHPITVSSSEKGNNMPGHRNPPPPPAPPKSRLLREGSVPEKPKHLKND